MEGPGAGDYYRVSRGLLPGYIIFEAAVLAIGVDHAGDDVCHWARSAVEGDMNREQDLSNVECVTRR